MRRIRSKITYANVVATLALFIALGGVSYAAVKLPKNSVGEKQIKKNAVTSKKIKKYAITGDKIKPGTITGAHVSLNALGKVPSAGTADSATTAGSAANQINVAKRVEFSSSNGSFPTARDQATEVPLGSHGQVSIYGKCFKSGGLLYAQTYLRSAADGAITSNSVGSHFGSPSYLNVATPEFERLVSTEAALQASAAASDYEAGVGAIFGPDGNGMNFHLQSWVKHGTPPAGSGGAFGTGDICLWTFSAAKVAAG